MRYLEKKGSNNYELAMIIINTFYYCAKIKCKYKYYKYMSVRKCVLDLYIMILDYLCNDAQATVYGKKSFWSVCAFRIYTQVRNTDSSYKNYTKFPAWTEKIWKDLLYAILGSTYDDEK